MLQVAIRGAHGVGEPGGNEDADGRDAIGMGVEEAEDLGLGVAEGVEDGAGFEPGASGRSMTNFMPTAHSRW